MQSMESPAHTSSRKERVSGLLLGLAAGDRNGGPVQMAYCIAASLLQENKCSTQDVASRYLKWFESEGFDTGPIAEQVFRLVIAGHSFEAAAKQVHVNSQRRTAGVNPAHRSTVFATASFLTDHDAIDAARRDAALTHFDPLAGDVAAVSTAICRSLLRCGDWEQALQFGKAAASDDRTRLAFQHVDSTAQLDRGGFAPKTLQAALYFTATSQSFTEAVLRSIAFAGPANYCPVLVGVFAGARWGANAVEPSLLKHCSPSFLDKLRMASDALGNSWKNDG